MMDVVSHKKCLSVLCIRVKSTPYFAYIINTTLRRYETLGDLFFFSQVLSVVFYCKLIIWDGRIQQLEIR